jgi:hypothetical protein
MTTAATTTTALRRSLLAHSRGVSWGRMQLDVFLQPAAEGLQQGIDLVDLGLKLKAEADATTGLLPLEIDALSVMPSTPGACRLGSVAFDLAGLAELASSVPRWVSVESFNVYRGSVYAIYTQD